VTRRGQITNQRKINLDRIAFLHENPGLIDKNGGLEEVFISRRDRKICQDDDVRRTAPFSIFYDTRIRVYVFIASNLFRGRVSSRFDRPGSLPRIRVRIGIRLYNWLYRFRLNRFRLFRWRSFWCTGYQQQQAGQEQSK
jgi:hypothetical protein